MKTRPFNEVNEALAHAADNWDNFHDEQDIEDREQMFTRLRSFVVERFTLVEILELALQSVRENQPEPKT